MTKRPIGTVLEYIWMSGYRLNYNFVSFFIIQATREKTGKLYAHIIWHDYFMDPIANV